MERTLQLIFELSDGKSTTVSFKEPKPQLTDVELKAAAHTILSTNVFQKNNCEYTKLKTAQLVSRAVSVYEL
jgi:hypothetical protein